LECEDGDDAKGHELKYEKVLRFRRAEIGKLAGLDTRSFDPRESSVTGVINIPGGDAGMLHETYAIVRGRKKKTKGKKVS